MVLWHVKNAYKRTEGLLSRNLYASRASLNNELSKIPENLAPLLFISPMIERRVAGLVGDECFSKGKKNRKNCMTVCGGWEEV